MNIQAVTNYKYCFTDVMIKLPENVNDARMFSTYTLNSDIRNGSIPRCQKVIVEGDPWGSCLPFIALFDERICEWMKRRV